MERKQLFNYPKDRYTLKQLQAGKLTEKQMREEYIHLRDVARKRLKRLEKSEFAKYNIYVQRNYEFIPITKIHTERDLIYRLAEVADFIAKENSSTLRGLRKARKEAVARAQEKGLTFINESNIEEYGRYMDFLKSLYKSKNVPDSERAMELFKIAEDKGINPDEILADFEFFMTNIDDFSKTEKITNKKKVSANDYRKQIEKKKR